jgi:hypothetical protein
MGADCSERICPSDLAHVTTSQGDMNMDGDFDDNSMKRIPSLTGTISVTYLSPTITLSASPAASYSKLQKGDGIVINGYNYIILNEVTPSTVFTLSSVYMGATDTVAVGYKHLETQCKASRGEFELWPGDFPAAADEGHHPMECSNRGSCDRKTGLCKCFPGYGGTACQRTTCPNDCSGHGTCEKVSELRTLQPKEVVLWTSGVKKDTSVSGSKGSVDLVPAADIRLPLSVGDSVIIGAVAVPQTIATISATAITLTTVLPEDFPAGTPIYLQPKYSLWDADKNRACKCDARFSGYDCSERKCPRGDDPLTVGQDFETQIVNIGGNNPLNKITGSFKLIFEDYFGEKWTTVSISVDGATDKTADVLAALKGLPNSVVQDALVTFIAISDKSIRYMIKFNGGATGTSTGNSGDLPTMGCDSSQLTTRLESAAIGGTITPSTPTGGVANSLLTFGTADANLQAVVIGDIVAGYDSTPALVGDFVVTAVTYSATPEIATITVAGACASCAAIKVVRNVKEGVPCTVSDKAEMIPATWAAAYVALAANTDGSTTAIPGITGFSLDGAANAALSVGDRIQLYKDEATQQILTVTEISTAALKFKEAITMNFPLASTKVYFYGKGTTEATTCSGRGLCDLGSGTCKCFKGYTMDDCSRQNVLAM